MPLADPPEPSPGPRKSRWRVAEGVITLIREDSDQLCLIYAAYRGNMSVDALTFFTRARLFERNLAFFRDAGRDYYQGGVSESISSFAALLDWQRRFLRTLPHVRRVFCLGTSMGAVAALMFGRLLDVEEVWAFAPPTTQLEAHKIRAPLDLPEEQADLARLLASPGGRTIFNVYYNAGYVKDESAALRLAGCPGVRLHARDGAGHDVVTPMIRSGLLETLLPAPSERDRGRQET
jgi:hypothetical protein